MWIWERVGLSSSRIINSKDYTSLGLSGAILLLHGENLFENEITQRPAELRNERGKESSHVEIVCTGSWTLQLVIHLSCSFVKCVQKNPDYASTRM